MVLALLVLLDTACASRPLIARAIRARGGPLRGFVRQVESDVHIAFPGTWRWRSVFLAPERYAWTIFTTAVPDHYLFDGTTARAFVGDRLVAEDASPTSPLRTQARFTAVTNLDALLLPGVQVAALPPGELPAGAEEGLAVVYAGDGARYRLGFDARTLLVVAEGPVTLLPAASGPLLVHFDDFRRTGRWLLAHRADYRFRGEPLAAERTLALCPDPPGLSEGSFRAPGALPGCAD